MEIDLRTLPGTRETIAYQEGGLFPVLALAPDGGVVAVLRGGAGHLGREGRIEVIRSRDGGLTWTPPSVVADSDRDDRNPALGVSAAGTLVLAYHRQGSYDEDGNYRPLPRGAGFARPVEIVVTHSADGGLTWEQPTPLTLEVLRPGSPYGKIARLADGTLLLPIYDEPRPAILGPKLSQARPDGCCSYLVRSRDDGRTWDEPTLIGVNLNETGLLALPDGDLLAVARGDDAEQALWVLRSADAGRTWSEPVQLTGSRQHPADLVQLGNGDVLLTYGNRTPPYRIEGRVSRDGGRSWLDRLLAFSGHLYGYDLDGPRPTDLGYPSNAIVPMPDGRVGVTMYYYNPSLNQPASGQRAGEPRYLARDYRAVAVTWREDELIAALGGSGL
jgi:hypothetical protein